LGHVTVHKHITYIQQLAFGVSLVDFGECYEDHNDDKQTSNQKQQHFGKAQTGCQSMIISDLLSEGAEEDQEEDPGDEGYA
jgi:hypothetical protein